MTGMDTLTQDWGTKWNRIKSAALRGGAQSANCSFPLSTSSDPIVNFVDNKTGEMWSYPLMIKDGAVVSSYLVNGQNIGSWSWDASDTHNQAVGGKTAQQLCESLGSGWKLPSSEDFMKVGGNELGGLFAKMPKYTFWTYTEGQSAGSYQRYRFSDGFTDAMPTTARHPVMCIKN